MRKLSLSLEELTVDSFETTDGANGRGTVLGRGGSPDYSPYCYPTQLPEDPTCAESCSCDGQCPDTGGTVGTTAA